MRFVVDKEEVSFFETHGWLELETGPFTTLLQKILPWVESTMERAKLKVHLGGWSLGRDLWREEKKLMEFVSHPIWGQIFSILSKKKPLRLGWDACFTTDIQRENVGTVLLPLEEKCSLKGCLGGVLFVFKPELHLFFIEAHRPMNELHEVLSMSIVEEEEEKISQLYYFLGLTSAVSQYKPLPQDPFRDWLKGYGIIVGGVLSYKTHPIVYR